MAKPVGYTPISELKVRFYVPIHTFFCPDPSLVEPCTFAPVHVGTRPRRGAFERLARGTISSRPAARGFARTVSEVRACLDVARHGSVLVSRAFHEDNRSHLEDKLTD